MCTVKYNINVRGVSNETTARSDSHLAVPVYRFATIKHISLDSARIRDSLPPTSKAIFVSVTDNTSIVQLFTRPRCLQTTTYWVSPSSFAAWFSIISSKAIQALPNTRANPPRSSRRATSFASKGSRPTPSLTSGSTFSIST